MNTKKIRPLILLGALLFAAGCRAANPSSPTGTDPGAEATSPAETGSEADAIYLDPSQSPDARADDLLGRMTLEEKIGQMTLVEKNSITPQAVTDKFIGAVLSGGGGRPSTNDPEHWAEMVDGFQSKALETRLAIPLLYGVDAVHGHGNLKGATIFPHNIGLGAAADPDLMFRIGQATAEEVAATGIWWNFAPVLAVTQDIRWGRTYESYSQDPELVSLLASAYLRGLQGENLADPLTVLATPKHFVGDGGVVWGTSTTQNYSIDRGDTQIDEDGLRSIHLYPYLAAIEDGAQSVMVSFSSWNGTKLHEHQYLITEVLKGELGFEGFVVSDLAGIDEVDSNYYNAVVRAINAGIDMNMVPTQYDLFIMALTAAVENEEVPMDRIDDAVRRILRVKFMLGLFEAPFSDPDLRDIPGSQAHRELAREAVAKSLVLLQNRDDVLPAAKDLPLVFVAGDFADDVGVQSGGWTIEWQGGRGNITPGTTVLEAIRAAVGPDTDVRYNRFGTYDRVLDEDGNPAIAELGIVVIGEAPYSEGVGDAEDLSIPEADVANIARVAERVEQLVVILISGRPLIITDQLDMADAWVAAWLPGTEGQGVADVLFGDRPFQGKLPFAWPLSMEQLPLGTNHDESPLFPLGYGLEAGR